ncbi:MAG: ParB/RepB/Spo0J family partition protein [Patescibacteria group bacterium]
MDNQKDNLEQDDLKKQTLGRGLSALIQNASVDGYKEVSLTLIIPNPYQPRREPSKELDELIASIKENGILSPLLVTKAEEGKYQLIAGERRLNAAKKLGLLKVPIIIKEALNEELLAFAIIENFQRKDLNVMEQAVAISNLQDQFDMDILDIAKKIGISKATAESYLKLLSLPQFIQEAIYNNKIVLSQAEELLRLTDLKLQQSLLNKMIKDGLSGSKAHELIDKLLAMNPKLGVKKANVLDQRALIIENHLKSYFGRVKIKRNSYGKGSINIAFGSDQELDDIYKKLNINSSVAGRN